MNKQFANDILAGFSAKPKYLPTKYLLDKEGERLLRAIMGLSEYYLTDAEFEIFYANKRKIFKHFCENGEGFNLIEFAAGDALKTKVLLRFFISEKVDFTYIPVDLYKDPLKKLKMDLSYTFPQLKIKTINKEYLDALNEVQKNNNLKNIVLFLGSAIGNYYENDVHVFYSELKKNLNPNDIIVTGVDLKKDPLKIYKAYNDKFGITSDFYLNLLNRINEEFDADFNLSAFYHYSSYDPIDGNVRNYLVSKYSQIVKIEKLNKSFDFDYSETVFMGISKKYDLDDIEQIAHKFGFEIVEHFIDGQRYFLDTIWKVK